MKNLLVPFVIMAAIIALLPAPLFGQYNLTSAYALVDNTPYCNEYGKCTYVTQNNCTAATTPPDMSVRPSPAATL